MYSLIPCFPFSASNNRINCRDLDDEITIPANEMPLQTFLPQICDYVKLDTHLNVLVQQLLCECIPHFQLYYSDVIEHIAHDHEDDSMLKSELVKYCE